MWPWIYVRVAAALALREQNEKTTCPGRIGRIFEVYLFRQKSNGLGSNELSLRRAARFDLLISFLPPLLALSSEFKLL